jgi:hypothetical protein
MKYSFVSVLILFLCSFAYSAYSQVEDEEIMMRSNEKKRDIKEGFVLDFGQVKGEAKTLKFAIPNKGTTELKIEYVSIPEGVGVALLSKVIKPGSEGEVAVIIDPKYMQAGPFTKDLKITTITIDETGTIIEKSGSISLKGEVIK